MSKTTEQSGRPRTCWVGLDVSKATFDAALAGPDQRFPSTPLRGLPWKAFPRTRAGVKLFLRWLDEQAAHCENEGVRVVMEATGQYSVELTTWLLAARLSLRPAIENPHNTKAFIDSLNQRNRTDGLAARGLAFYGVERHPVPYEPLSPTRQELRALSRYRMALVGQRTALKNRRQEGSDSRIVAQMQTRQLRQLDRDIATIEEQIKRVLREDSVLQRDFELLVSVDGVGFITAMTVLAEIGDMRRFERARQLTAYVGVSPRVVQSGTSVRGKTHMCKRGNARLRYALYLSAMATLNTKHPNTLSGMYQRLRENAKEPRSAIGAVMRKQLTVMRAVVVSGKPYDPAWNNGGQRSAKTTSERIFSP